jgi:hypothetical protein
MTKITINHLRRNAVAYLALFLALGGTSYAVSRPPANSVDTPQLVNGAVTAPKLGRLPAVSAFSDDFEQQLSDGVWATIRLDKEAFDTGRMHSPGENDTRVVAPRTGTYVVQGTVTFNEGGDSVALQHVKRGGRVDLDNAHAGGAFEAPSFAHVGAIVRMRAGEYLELAAIARSRPKFGVSGRLSAVFVGS